MKIFYFILFFLTTSFLNAQTKFQPGHITFTSGEQLDCEIKIKNWQHIPTSIQYRINQYSEILSINQSNIKNFEIFNVVKFESHSCKLSDFSNENQMLTNDSLPLFLPHKGLFQVLIEGNISLFKFKGSNGNKYFIKINNGNLEQLVYKKYIDRNGNVKHYNHFIKRLSEIDPCNNELIVNLQYKEKSLCKHILEFNQCQTQTTEIFIDLNEKNLKFNIRTGLCLNEHSFYDPGINLAVLSIFQLDYDFESALSPHYGFEFEYIIPNYLRTSSLISEFVYRQFKSNKYDSNSSLAPSLQLPYIRLDYKTILFSLGMRKYHHFNKNISLYIDGSLLLDWDLNSFYDFENEFFTDLPIASSPGANLSIGIKARSIQLQYQYSLPRNLYSPSTAKFNSSSFIIGYSI